MALGHHEPGTTIPAALEAELGRLESVVRVVPARLAASPRAPSAIAGALAVTSERLSLVPGADVPALRERPTVAEVFQELWSLVRPMVRDAWPTAALWASRPLPAVPFGRPTPHRGRAGIDIPLHLVRRAFVSGSAPGWVGVELALPTPDPRPPFALYFEVGDATADAIAGDVERHRPYASPRPELERPYGLYYLFRPPPRIFVRADGHRGLLELGVDGPTFRRGSRVETLVPYESITAVEIAAETDWRRGVVRLCLEDRAVVLKTSRAAAARLVDFARVVAELANVPVRLFQGPVAGGRVAWRLTWLGAAGAVAYEIARVVLGS